MFFSILRNTPNADCHTQTLLWYLYPINSNQTECHTKAVA